MSAERPKALIVKDLLLNLAGIALVGLAILVSLGKVIAGQWLTAGGTIVFYLLLLSIFLMRGPSKETVGGFRHSAFALAGTFLPLLVHLSSHPNPTLVLLSLPIELLGLGISVTALGSLGRGFGIFAANREVKTRGLYRFIRHPLYAGEAIWFLALVLQNLSVFNVALFVVQITCQTVRMRDEEALLRRDPVYAAYFEQVRSRLLPGLY